MQPSRSIQLLTEIPGPRSREILARKEEVVAAPVTVQAPTVIASALGAVVTDVDGNRFLDFAGGIGCLVVGHCHPTVVEAVREQAGRFIHTDFAVVPYEIYTTVAARLIAAAPFTGPARAAFFNSGAEAIENAIKFARLATGRPAVIAFEGGFHGRTLLALTMTSKANPYKVGLGPLAPAVYHLPYAQEYRGPSSAEALAELERALVTQVSASEVAAIVVEPIQGEGGFVPAPEEFMHGLRRICDQHGIVLIVDEVQTGFGRTGAMFAIEHYGIEPDLIVVAKALASGLPLSGVIGKAAIMDAPHEGAIGGTYAGNPVALAAANAVLDVIEAENLIDRAKALGETIRARMSAWQDRFEQIGDVRGRGAMLAIELVKDRGSKEPAPELATRVIEEALQRGLLLLKAGIYSNCVRVLAPLVISDDELAEALDVWEEALAAALAS
jgi:4-aminobutyrate aminotransferase / (S)-3-amino-2-methylpropionate transaminase / 5-aminovalerate transaminase